MKNYIAILGILIFSLTACEKLDIQKDTPGCLKRKIRKFELAYSCEEGVKVVEYLFQGKSVYVFEPGTCGADQTSEVMDNDCETLGHLGGIAGNLKINNEDFSTAEFQQVVWER